MQPSNRKTPWWQGLLLGAGLLALLVLLAPAGAGADNNLIVDNGDTLYVPPSITYDNEYIGENSQGTLVHLFGSNTVHQFLVLGDTTTGNGTYYLYPFGRLTVGRDEFLGNFGTGRVDQSGGKHTVARTLFLSINSGSSGTLNLKGGSLQVDIDEYIGYYLGSTGTVNQGGGKHTVGGTLVLAFYPGSSATLNLKGGSLQADGDEYIGFSGTGTVNQSGGKHTVAGNLLLAFNGNEPGTYNLSGGTLTAGAIDINLNGTFNVLNTSTTVTAGSFTINNGGTFNVLNSITTLTGDVLNFGTVNTTKAAVTWNGNFDNFGAYISDHAKQTFTDLTVEDPPAIKGYLKGASQDLFIVKNDFINKSTNDTDWDTAAATLKFVTGAGWDTDHNFYIPGADNGMPGDVKVTELPFANFAWGTLFMFGQTVHLFDGNGDNGSTAQYVGGLAGAKVNWFTKMVDNIINDDVPINIYYDPDLLVNWYLHGKTYNLAGTGGGQLIPFHTPLPPSILLLGSGLLGLGLLGYRRKRG